MTEDCDPSPDDQFGSDPPPITDMNGIALRLCVTGFKNAQDAIKASYKNCNIVKVAALGFVGSPHTYLRDPWAFACGKKQYFVALASNLFMLVAWMCTATSLRLTERAPGWSSGVARLYPWDDACGGAIVACVDVLASA